MAMIAKLLLDSHEFYLSRPEGSRGAINVVCGPNNSGKSFLLKAVHRLLQLGPGYQQRFGKEHHGGYALEFTETGKVAVLRADVFTYKDRIGLIDYGKESRRRKPSEGKLSEIELQSVASGVNSLIYEILAANTNIVEIPGFDSIESRQDFVYRFNSSTSFRRRVISLKFDHDIARYRDGRRRPSGLFAMFEKYIRGPIGLLKADKGLELCYLERGKNVRFEDWSDGLKALVCLESALYARKADVVLIDEIEHHLHPFLISSALETLANFPVQSIITTHHPHVIFSRFVDCAFYLERIEGDDPLRDWKRRLFPLTTNFEKVLRTYSLFSNQDDLLLKQARYIRNSADIKFYDEFLRSFGYEVFVEKGGRLADTQTEAISDAIEDLRDHNKPAILDIGAGLGRTFFEAKKTRIVRSKTINPEWWLWEPNQRSRLALADRVAEASGESVALPSCPEEIPRGHFDFILVVNVLHELSSLDLSKAILLAKDALKEHGYILVGEIFPLLHAEKFAVPYNQVYLKEIFSAAGLRATVRNVTFHGGAGYFIVARNNPKTSAKITEAGLQRSIKKTWKKIRRELIDEYFGNPGKASDFINYRSMIQTLNTIASIDADEEDLWSD